MANQNSAEIALQVGGAATPLDPTQAHGRQRIAHFQFDSLTTVAGDAHPLVKLPAGKVRVLQVKALHSAFDLNATLSIGNLIYTSRTTRNAVPASVNSVATAVAVDNVTDINRLSDVIFDSAGGVTLTGVIAVAGGTAETLRGWVEYVID